MKNKNDDRSLHKEIEKLFERHFKLEVKKVEIANTQYTTKIVVPEMERRKVLLISFDVQLVKRRGGET